MVAVSLKKIFLKQKTAYAITSSDWSSDVCSSDLLETAGEAGDLVTIAARMPEVDAHFAALKEAMTNEL